MVEFEVIPDDAIGEGTVEGLFGASVRKLKGEVEHG